jgi:hypothetical protein
MKSIKHIGRMKNTGAKVIVVFRTLPGDSGSALVLGTTTLSDSYHDALMTVLESDQGQDVNEFGEIMYTRMFSDGRPMLVAMQQDNRLQKVATDNVIMTPTPNHNVPLDELNVLIAGQKNMAVDDLAGLVSGATASKARAEVKTVVEVKETPAPVRAQASQNEALTDLDIAKSYRSQADAMYKEAARLRKQADDLDPPKKKATKASEETSA